MRDAFGRYGSRMLRSAHLALRDDTLHGSQLLVLTLTDWSELSCVPLPFVQFVDGHDRLRLMNRDLRALTLHGHGRCAGLNLDISTFRFPLSRIWNSDDRQQCGRQRDARLLHTRNAFSAGNDVVVAVICLDVKAPWRFRRREGLCGGDWASVV